MSNNEVLLEILKPYIPNELKNMYFNSDSDTYTMTTQYIKIKPKENSKTNSNEYTILDININISDVIKLLYSDYVIFLTSKFLSNKSWIFNFKKSLLSYFDKYNILYFDYAHKNKIQYIVNILNNFIKNSTQNDKDELLNFIIYLNDYSINISKKMKIIYFSEDIIEPYVLYKKIKFSNQEIFIPFNNYILKKMEYKLRTFCQIAEKLGAEKIEIEYNSSKHEDKKLDLNVNALALGGIGSEFTSNKDNNENIKIVFEYPNNYSDINLNKFYIINSINNEKEFLISKDEFYSDLELKFLIDARCINFIQKYNTIIIMNYINKIEQKIFLKAYNYGLNIGNLSNKNSYVKISISIDFLKIQDNLDIIDGTNIHVQREGFIYLSNIIKKDNKYIKILRFLQSYLNAVDKKLIALNYNYEHISLINKIYNEIVNLNFNEEEITLVIETFFKNNLSWYSFKKFRDLILNGSDDKLEKLYFITFQYHDILNNKIHIMNDIKNNIDIVFDDFIKNFNKITIINNNSISNSSNKNNKECKDTYNIIEITNYQYEDQKILKFIIKNKDSIKNILYTSYRKSFKFNNGLLNNIFDIELLNNTIYNIINYYFENNIKKLQINLNIFIELENLEDQYNIKNNIFNKLIDKITFKIVHNLNLSEMTPNIINGSNDKISLYQRVQKIFLKFVIKYFDFENKSDLIIKKLGLNVNIIEPIHLIDFLETTIKLNNIFKNYNKFKVLYTWNDFIAIKEYFLKTP
jgi:hypothetical protein